MNFLILASNPTGYSTTQIIKALEKRGHSGTVLKPKDFYLHCSDSTKGYDAAFVKGDRIFKKDINGIIPRVGGGLAYGAHVVRHFTENLSMPTTSSAEGILLAADKWASAQILSKNKVQIPKTTICDEPEDFGFLVNSVGGLPCVAKLTYGSQGKGIFILETELAGSTALSAFSNAKQQILLQQFIETAKEDERKSDIRAWVVDNRVVAAYRRFSMHKDFRSNYSLSKEGEKVELTLEENVLAINAAAAVGLGCAGVDIMRDVNDNNRPYVIEINGNASLAGIEKVTGVDVAGAIAEYAIKIGKSTPMTSEPSGISRDLLPTEAGPEDSEMSQPRLIEKKKPFPYSATTLKAMGLYNRRNR